MKIYIGKHKVTKRFLPLIAVSVFLLIWPGIALSKSKKEEEKKETPEYSVSGRDPKAFADASAMFAIPDQTSLDEQAAKMLISKLGTAARNEKLWSPDIWLKLNSLRSVKIPLSEIQSLRTAARMISVEDKYPSAQKVKSAKKAFDEGNKYYKSGNFNQSIQSYRTALEEYPAYWDAWNNLSLAEMHNNNDLVAFFLLSALTWSNSKYVGGLINLSVCMERLGLYTEAYDVAGSWSLLKTKIPMVHYNMAWFENFRGQYNSADGYICKALDSVNDYDIAKRLQAINTMESG